MRRGSARWWVGGAGDEQAEGRVERRGEVARAGGGGGQAVAGEQGRDEVVGRARDEARGGRERGGCPVPLGRSRRRLGRERHVEQDEDQTGVAGGDPGAGGVGVDGQGGGVFADGAQLRGCIGGGAGPLVAVARQ